MQRKRSTTKQRFVRLFILLIGGFTMLCFLFADPLLRTYRKHDRKDAPVQTGVATVVTLVPAPVNEEGNTHPPAPLVSVRFRGGLHTAQQVIGFDALKQNQPARITYRVGRSGTIYVEQVAPLKENGQ